MAVTKFEQDVLQGIATLNTRFDEMEKRESKSKYDPGQCAVHEEKFKVSNKRISALERQQGKQNMVAATMGAVGTGLALLVKYVSIKVSGG